MMDGQEQERRREEREAGACGAHSEAAIDRELDAAGAALRGLLREVLQAPAIISIKGNGERGASVRQKKISRQAREGFSKLLAATAARSHKPADVAASENVLRRCPRYGAT